MKLSRRQLRNIVESYLFEGSQISNPEQFQVNSKSEKKFTDKTELYGLKNIRYSSYNEENQSAPKYIRGDFQTQGFDFDIIIETQRIFKQTGESLKSKELKDLPLTDAGDKVEGIIINSVEYITEWVKEYIAKITSNRIKNLIDKYKSAKLDPLRRDEAGGSYEDLHINLEAHFKKAVSNMKKTTRIIFSRFESSHQDGFYVHHDVNHPLYVRIDDSGSFARNTIEHELQHKHTDFFRIVNEIIQEQTGVIVDYDTKVGWLGPLGEKAYNSLMQHDGKIKKFSFEDGDNVTLNLPDLDYRDKEDVNKIFGVELSDDNYATLFYNFRRDHISELLSRLASLSDKLGNSEATRDFVKSWIDRSLDYPDIEATNYLDLKEAALALKLTDKNIDYFTVRLNQIVKNSQQSNDTRTV
jgi:hypothetical protein